MSQEILAYSPSARYGCRYNPVSVRSSHKFHINDFETEKIYEVYLTSNFTSTRPDQLRQAPLKIENDLVSERSGLRAMIMHYYWPDDDHLCVIYKKTSNYIYKEKSVPGKSGFYTEHCNRECRMLYKIKGFETTKELFPIKKRSMKPYIDSKLVDQCTFSEQYLTINKKEYLVMFYEPLFISDEFRMNEDQPWETITEDEDPWGIEPRFCTQEEIDVVIRKNIERGETAKKAEEAAVQRGELDRIFTKTWFRFIPKQFDDDELPEIQIDIKEVLDTFGMELYDNHDVDRKQPFFGHAVFARGPYFYIVRRNNDVLKMNLQTFFDSLDPVLKRLKPKSPWFCKDRLIVGLKKAAGYLPRLGLLLRVNRLRDFRKIGDLFIHIVNIETNENVGTFKILNKRDMFNGNDVSIHPSGQILCFRSESEHYPTRFYLGSEYSDHWLKHIKLSPLLKSNKNVFNMNDESKTPKFIKNGKRTSDMKLQKTNCK